MNEAHYDAIVIGGGIAGASVAAQLSSELRVSILERESQPGYHATGRSAAIFSEIYGNAAIRALSRASRPFFFDPPEGFSDVPLIGRRGSLYVARADQLERLNAFAAIPEIAEATMRLSAREARIFAPLLRENHICAALHEPAASDIDVHALMQGYLRQLRAQGGRLLTNAEVLALEHQGGFWRVHTSAGDFSARIIVNAAGAWADRIATMAGAVPVGIRPLRRTAALVDAPPEFEIAAWPLTIDIDEQFYFKPDAGKILLSPAEETPSQPCDAMPEDIDVAIAVDRIEAATTLEIKNVRRKWAGLRSFVNDRSPVIGHDPVAPGFFWVAALGGYGIQTAPAVGRLAANLICGKNPSEILLKLEFDPCSVAPQRF